MVCIVYGDLYPFADSCIHAASAQLRWDCTSQRSQLPTRAGPQSRWAHDPEGEVQQPSCFACAQGCCWTKGRQSSRGSRWAPLLPSPTAPHTPAWDAETLKDGLQGHRALRGPGSTEWGLCWGKWAEVKGRLEARSPGSQSSHWVLVECLRGAQNSYVPSTWKMMRTRFLPTKEFKISG